MMMQKSLPILQKYSAPLLKIAVGILAYHGLLSLFGEGVEVVVALFIGAMLGFSVFLTTTTFLERNTPPQARPSKPEGRQS